MARSAGRALASSRQSPADPAEVVPRVDPTGGACHGAVGGDVQATPTVARLGKLERGQAPERGSVEVGTCLP